MGGLGDTSPTPPPPGHALGPIDRLLEDANLGPEPWVARNKTPEVTTYKTNSSQTSTRVEQYKYTLRADHLQRHRYVLSPDEAFAAIFSWDVIVKNSREFERQCWDRVAEERGLIPPDLEDIVRAEQMPAESAISRVFYWTNDWAEIKRTVYRKQEVVGELEKGFNWKATDGLINFLKALITYGVKCIISTKLPSAKVVWVMQLLGLQDIFTKSQIVSSDDDCDSLEDMMLAACMKAQRPPDKCVVFTDNPSGITAGHEIMAKVVAVHGAHPAYELKTADHIVSDFDDLVVYNIRRLFSEEDVDVIPETQLEN